MTIFIGITSVAIAVIVIIPTVQDILSLEKSITETQKFLEQQYEKTQRMRRSIHSLDSIDSQMEKFKEALVQEGDELKIITELEKIAAENGIDQNLRVQRIESKDIKAGGPPDKKIPQVLKNKPYYIFSFTNTGRFPQHIEYIKSLEKLPYLFDIELLQFVKKESGGSVELRFNAKLYII